MNTEPSAGGTRKYAYAKYTSPLAPPVPTTHAITASVMSDGSQTERCRRRAGRAIRSSRRLTGWNAWRNAVAMLGRAAGDAAAGVGRVPRDA